MTPAKKMVSLAGIVVGVPDPYGSGSADQYYWITDGDPDIALSFIGFHFRLILLDT